MSDVTLGEIADFVQGEFHGDRAKPIRGVRPLVDAGEDHLSFLANPKYEKQLASTRAAGVLVERGQEGDAPSWIRVGNPYFAFARVLQRWFSGIPFPEGIAPNAVIAPTAKLGSDVRIGNFVSIGERSVIGDRAVLMNGVSIGEEVAIGDDTIVYPNVSVYHRSIIGRRCVVQAGAVIGSDGFGFVTAEGKHHKIPQIGIVRIEDDVEVGANTTIDRAALGETVIGEGTKIDNLVQIAHNVRLGKHCIIVSQVGIAGSTEMGDYVVAGGQAGISGHLRIGSQVMIAARAAVMKDFHEPMQIAGAPARPLRDHLRSEAMLRRLPKVLERLRTLERKSGLTDTAEDSNS